jgi:hypothetical protein
MKCCHRMGAAKFAETLRASPFNKHLSTLLEKNHYSTLLLYGGPYMCPLKAASNNIADFRCRCCYSIYMRFMKSYRYNNAVSISFNFNSASTITYFFS